MCQSVEYVDFFAWYMIAMARGLSVECVHCGLALIAKDLAGDEYLVSLYLCYDCSCNGSGCGMLFSYLVKL